MGKQSRLKQQRRNTPAKAKPTAQALQIAGYEQIIQQQQAVLTRVAGLFGELMQCQSLEEIHTTIQRALDSGLLSGDMNNEQ